MARWPNDGRRVRILAMSALLLAAVCAVGAGQVAGARSSPSEVLDAITIDGFVVEPEPGLPTRDLTFSEVESLTDSISGVDLTADEVASYRAAFRTWVSKDSDDAVLVAASTNGSAASTAGLVRGAIDASRLSGTEIEPPFDEASATVTDTDGVLTTFVAWPQGEFAVYVIHLSYSAPLTELTSAIVEQVERGIRSHTGAVPGAPQRTENSVAYRIGYILGPCLLLSLIVGVVSLVRHRRGRAARRMGPPLSPWPAPPAPPQRVVTPEHDD